MEGRAQGGGAGTFAFMEAAVVSDDTQHLPSSVAPGAAAGITQQRCSLARVRRARLAGKLDKRGLVRGVQKP